MKTSNKILLGIFLTILLLTTTVQLMVYAKYKRGDYVAFQREKFITVASVKLPATRFVSVKNLGTCVLINSDTSRFETDEDKAGAISFRVANDTLIINGDTTLTADQLQHGERNFHLIKIYIPASVPVNAASCNLFIDGSVDSAHAPAYNIHLSKKSELNIRQSRRGKFNYIGQLLINSDDSYINFDHILDIKELNLTLALSRLAYTQATFRKLTLNTDNASTITLSGQNLNALK